MVREDLDQRQLIDPLLCDPTADQYKLSTASRPLLPTIFFVDVYFLFLLLRPPTHCSTSSFPVVHLVKVHNGQRSSVSARCSQSIAVVTQKCGASRPAGARRCLLAVQHKFLDCCQSHWPRRRRRPTRTATHFSNSDSAPVSEREKLGQPSGTRDEIPGWAREAEQLEVGLLKQTLHRNTILGCTSL